MPVALDLVVANPALQRTAYTHIKVYRAATVAGPFAEISTPTTRLPLSNEVSYTYFDPTGEDTNYYRISYWNQRTGRESAQGPAIQGAPDPALSVISIDELKTNFLFGVNLTDDRGREFPPSLFRWYIQSAVSWLEHTLDMPIRPQVITGERHDFFAGDFYKFQMIRTHLYPIISVQEVRATFPGSDVSTPYDASWIKSDLMPGYVEIVPGQGAAGFPIFTGGGVLLAASSRRYVPHTMEIDYTAGFPAGQIPPVIRDLAGKLASFGPLNIAGDLISGAGIANYSISLDGLSQSVGTTSSATNSGYGARLLIYQKEIKDQLAQIRRYYKGIRSEVA